MVEKYYDDNGDMVVLVSTGFGAGWSTWNCPELAFDKRIVEFYIKNKPSEDEMENFLSSIGYEDIYMGGYDDIKIERISKGIAFRIDEYDGSESIETLDFDDWVVA